MSIKYCDFLTGSDTTGDGSAGNPYQTIDKASEGLTGGDEVRVAKSPNHTALTGTLSFVEGSNAVVGSGTNFTGELAQYDFIIGADGLWYMVNTITDNTHLTLSRKYTNVDSADQTIQKVGVTDVGSVRQTLIVSGSSGTVHLVISGGWDLTSETQTGITTFRGNGSMAVIRKECDTRFITISKINCLRGEDGIVMGNDSNPMYLEAGCNIKVLDYIGNGNQYTGMDISCNHYHLENVQTCFNNDTGVKSRDSVGSYLKNLIANGNTYEGLDLDRTHTFLAEGYVICNYNDIYGVAGGWGYGTSDLTFDCEVTVCHNIEAGFYSGSSTGLSIKKLTANYNVGYGVYFDFYLDFIRGDEWEANYNGKNGFECYINAGRVGKITAIGNTLSGMLIGAGWNFSIGEAILEDNLKGGLWQYFEWVVDGFSIEKLSMSGNGYIFISIGGSATWTQGSDEVTEVSSDIIWRPNVGDLIQGPDGNVYEIVSIDTVGFKFVLISNYAGTTSGGGLIFAEDGNVPSQSNINWSYAFSPYTGLRISDYKGQGAYNFWFFGRSMVNTVEARGGSGKCLQIAPRPYKNKLESYPTYSLLANFLYHEFDFKADALVEQTVGIYVKKDSAYNGIVQAKLEFHGKSITEWTDFLPSVADVYQLKTLVADSAKIYADSVLKLVLRAKASAGNIYVDDISIA